MSKKNLLGTESLAEKMKKVKQEIAITHTDKDSSMIDKAKKIKQESKTNPKLYVSGRLDRKKHNYVAKSLILLESMDTEIKQYCRGVDLAILNYLIWEGLNSIKASSDTINIDMKEIESNIHET